MKPGWASCWRAALSYPRERHGPSETTHYSQQGLSEGMGRGCRRRYHFNSGSKFSRTGKPLASRQVSSAVCLEMGINGAEHGNQALPGTGNTAGCFLVAVINCC